MLQAGTNDVLETDDLTASHHFVSYNAGERPYAVDVREAHGFRSVTVPPGSIWIAPAGEPVTLRLDSEYPYIRLMVAPRHLDSLLARHAGEDTPVRFRYMFGISAAPIAYVLRALVAESDAGLPGGIAFVEALTMALGRQLSVHAGITVAPERVFRGGLSPTARRRVLELIDSSLDARLSVVTLATAAGLSPSHFARAFKETTGRAPHRYLLTARLERARRLLALPGATISEVAGRTGFADQSHFTRLFHREFGLTPGAYLRELRR